MRRSAPLTPTTPALRRAVSAPSARPSGEPGRMGRGGGGVDAGPGPRHTPSSQSPRAPGLRQASTRPDRRPASAEPRALPEGEGGHRGRSRGGCRAVTGDVKAVWGGRRFLAVGTCGWGLVLGYGNALGLSQCSGGGGRGIPPPFQAIPDRAPAPPRAARTKAPAPPRGGRGARGSPPTPEAVREPGRLRDPRGRLKAQGPPFWTPGVFLWVAGRAGLANAQRQPRETIRRHVRPRVYATPPDQRRRGAERRRGGAGRPGRPETNGKSKGGGPLPPYPPPTPRPK